MADNLIPWQELQLDGEVSLESRDLDEHTTDASVHEARPAAVAFPKTKADLEKIVAFCRNHHVSIHGWGAGTSRGGQPLGAGFVVDFRKHFREILAYDEATGELTVQCGAFYSEVQKFLKAKGRSFPPDPSYHQCTIGGMVANNAAGIHSVKYGGTIDHIAGLEFLTPDGQWHHTDQADDLSHAAERLARSADLSDFPKVEKNSAGYALNRATEREKFDLPKLFCGSEGTLALFSEIRIKSVPLPKATALGILYFPSLEAACQAAMDLRSYDAAACELVDKVLLDLHAVATAPTPPAGPKHAKKITGNKFLDLFYELNAEAVLVVEFEGASTATAAVELHRALSTLNATDMRIATTPEQVQLMWDLRRHTSPILNRLEDGKITIKPLWGVEDVSLPKETFLPYLQEQKELFARHGLTCSFFGHAASCNLHIDPIAIDPRAARKNEDLAKLFDLVAAESYELVVKFGGSISGEHGDGIARTPFLKLQYPKSHETFCKLKNLFDPSGILNPGKIVEVQNA